MTVFDWSAAFDVQNGSIPDGPTHFKNEKIRLISKNIKIQHHFTFPHSHWSNGAVKLLGQDVPKVFRSVTSKLQMIPVTWLDLLLLVQCVLNNALSSQLAGITPVKAFTGMDPTPLISTFIRSSDHSSRSVAEVNRERNFQTEELQNVIPEFYLLV